MMEPKTVLLLAAMLCTSLGCTDNSSAPSLPPATYEVEGTSTSGGFGFRAGLSGGEYGSNEHPLSGRGFFIAYVEDSTGFGVQLIDSFSVIIDEDTIARGSGSTSLDYVPGKRYMFSIQTDFGSAYGEVTAPTISGIRFKNLPVSHPFDSPLTIEWEYPPGESNDGAIVIDTDMHPTIILPPETTSYTFPVPQDSFWKNEEVTVLLYSIRYVRFPELLGLTDESIYYNDHLDDELKSYFSISTSVEGYIEITDSD